MKTLKWMLATTLGLVSMLVSMQAMALTFATDPLFLASTEPRVMLLMSRDHELSKKAYNDYSDLNDDGTIDTTYDDAISYYGYFDSQKCYNYSTSNKRFEPSGAVVSGHQCAGNWSGNFLNWAAMTRLDVVRKVLYGGFRSTDKATEIVDEDTVSGVTVLERQLLPNDVHAFAKVYAPAGGGAEINKYTPYAPSSGAISLCNVTDVTTNASSGSVNTATYPPLIKVASGSWPQWAMTEINQCIWREQKADNLTTRPTSASSRLTGTSDLVARVQVCKAGLLEDNCKDYYTRDASPLKTVKPTGLLQQYGDVDVTKRVRFGLITGSYSKNSNGGVLRKNITFLTNNDKDGLTSTDICSSSNSNDELNVCTGQFINQDTSNAGIINTLSRLRIADWQFNYSSGKVLSSSYNTCNSGTLLGTNNAGADGSCRDWGNPMAEMYYEALRYFAGKSSATSSYATTSDSSVISGINQATWNSGSDPLPSTEWCALSNIIMLSTGLNSFDTNTFAYDITGLASGNVTSFTNAVGSAEGVDGTNQYFVGNTDSDLSDTGDGMCTAKTPDSLDAVTGVCPGLPHMGGGYKLAGLADANRSVDLRPGYKTQREARWTGINSNWVARQPLSTYAVALAENLPTLDVAVGGSTVSIVPQCRSGSGTTGSTTCSLTDMKVEALSPTYGRFLASWEDGTAGSDYDMDVVERIEYRVSGNQISVTASVVQAATGASMKLGYSITGTSLDGTYFVINIVSTGDGGSTCSDTNKRQFSLISTPPSYGVNCSTTPSTSTCSYTNYLGASETVTIPTGVKSYTGYSCVNPDGTTGSNCGCPKSWTFTRSATHTASYLENPLWYAAKYAAPASSWDLKNNTTGAQTPDGEPDNFFFARNPGNLYKALANVFDSASQTDSAASSVATSSTSLNDQSYIFQGKFSPIDWSGDLLAYRVTTSGSITTPAKWQAADELNDQAAADRIIITKGQVDVSGTPVPAGVAFEWDNLTSGEQTYLNKNYLGVTDNCGSQRLAYLRGDDTHEGSSGTFTDGSCSSDKFRARDYKLGDIVNSNPWYVGKPSAGYPDSSYPGYSTFRTTYKTRKPVVYVTANDGMLHGFDASIGTDGEPAAGAGQEVLAYVPSQVYANLSKLTAQNYNKNHVYIADGSPFVGDASMPSLGDADVDAEHWRSVLVSGLNSGGKGYFALDVTNPSGLTGAAPTFAADNAGDLLLWEFTDADDADMGYSYNLPPQANITGQAKQIVRMANGKWAVVVGNGYNSANGKAVLYILYIDGGLDGTWTLNTDYKKLVADSGTGNGLSTPVPFDVDGDGKADVIYAGDLKGNLWKFDVSDSDPANWVVGTRNPDPNDDDVNGEGLALFTAKDASGTVQPITAPPEAVLNPNGGIMVLFGTGKYLESGDATSTQTQTVYGVWDKPWYNDPSPAVAVLPMQVVRSGTGSSDWLKQTLTESGSTATLTNNAYTTQKGWYIDLPSSKERVTGIPKVINGILFFNTIIPSTSPCESGGTGWLFAVDVTSGGHLSSPVFDTNGSGTVDSSDNAAVAGAKIGMSPGGTTLIRGSGDANGIGVTNLTSGNLATPQKLNFGPGTGGRVTWREIVR